MESAADDSDFGFCDFINQSVFLIYPSGPASLQLEFQRLRFPDAFKGTSFNILDQFIYSSEDFSVVFLPVKIIIP